MDILELIAGAYGYTGKTIDGIRDDQLHAPTPCAEWEVHDILAHVIGATAALAAAARREPLPSLDGDLVGDDPAATYEAVSSNSLKAWRTPGALDGTVTLPAGFEVPARVAAGITFFDSLVHGWDLARATGQDDTLDRELAEAALGIATGIVSEALRVSRFAPAIEPASEASAADRLLAFLGRQP
jgi:uncharacterized protein (TIGR03086 family)